MCIRDRPTTHPTSEPPAHTALSWDNRQQDAHVVCVCKKCLYLWRGACTCVPPPCQEDHTHTQIVIQKHGNEYLGRTSNFFCFLTTWAMFSLNPSLNLSRKIDKWEHCLTRLPILPIFQTFSHNINLLKISVLQMKNYSMSPGVDWKLSARGLSATRHQWCGMLCRATFAQPHPSNASRADWKPTTLHRLLICKGFISSVYVVVDGWVLLIAWPGEHICLKVVCV